MKKALLCATQMILALGIVPARATTISTASPVAVGQVLSVVSGDTTSDTVIHFFFESTQTLASDLSIDLALPGTYLGSTSISVPAPFIAAGTAVESWLFHFQRESSGVELTGSVTFSSPILGLVFDSPSLDATDFLGALGTTYPIHGTGQRGLEGDNDSVAISADLKTVTVHMQGASYDQVRVFTNAGAVVDIPEPGTLGLLLIGGLLICPAIIFRKRS